MRATAGTRRHPGLAAVGALIVMVASMSPAFAGAGAGPSTSTTAPSSSTTSTSTSSTSTSSTTPPPTTPDPVYYGVSSTIGFGDPAAFFPSSTTITPPSSTTTTPPPTVVMTMHATITTRIAYDFGARDPGPQESAEEPSSAAGAERVVFRGPATTESPGASTTTTEPVRPVSRSQDSAALAAATSPDGTRSGVSLFWPVILGLCCLLLLGGPVAARRLRHPH